jgi:hypothetical protein
MFVASCAQTHQSLFSSFGAPTPISLWNPLIAVPQRKPSGKGARTAARAGLPASARRSATVTRGWSMLAATPRRTRLSTEKRSFRGPDHRVPP